MEDVKQMALELYMAQKENVTLRAKVLELKLELERLKSDKSENTEDKQ